jgi:hypothetical protein
MSHDLERRRRTVTVLDLLDQSFAAQGAERSRLIQAATDLDVEAVAIIQGGMLIGEIPNPERDRSGWDEYVQAARDSLAEVES